MNTIFNLLCPICTEIFHNDDDIYCTSCGHVLHYRCLQEWLQRSVSCPQCRNPNPTTHKIYLSFDESAEAAANVTELKASLAEYKLLVDGLKDDLVLKEEEIQSLQTKQVELSNSVEQKRIESEALIKNIECLEQENSNQLHELETQAKEMETLKLSTDATIGELRNEIAGAQSKDIPSTSEDTAFKIRKLENDLENASILLAEEVSKNKIMSVEHVSSQAMLFKEKVKVLEQRLKHITTEFENEISKSTQLEIDNMKLKNYVDCMKLNTSSMNNAQVGNDSLPNIRNMRNCSFASSTESISSRKGRNHDFCDSSSNSIVIQKYPTSYLQYPLENVVELVARHIGIAITNFDIDKVNIAKSNSKQLKEFVTLFVRFKAKERKNLFLANKSRLMVCAVPYLRTVQINEYIDDRAQNLFAYASGKLNGKGYNHIFWTNNQIFAKRNKSDLRGIRIISCQQVDELLKQFEMTKQKSLSIDLDDYDKL